MITSVDRRLETLNPNALRPPISKTKSMMPQMLKGRLLASQNVFEGFIDFIWVHEEFGGVRMKLAPVPVSHTDAIVQSVVGQNPLLSWNL